MGKKSKSVANGDGAPASSQALFGVKSGFDTSLSALFSSSAGPVRRETVYSAPIARKAVQEQENDEDEVENDQELSELEDEEFDDEDDEQDEAEDDEDDEYSDSESESEDLEDADEKDELLDGEAVATVDGEVAEAQPDDTIPDIEESTRKRKRKRDNDDLEDVYMQKLAREEAKEQAARDAERGIKRQKADREAKTMTAPSTSKDEDGEDYVPPQHESLAPSSAEASVEQASRTVFLGNVSNTAITSKTAKKTLLTHLASFIPSLPAHDPPHKVESLRFRSVAFSSSVPKKAAFAKKDLMDATTKSTNAYAVYSTITAAKEAAKRLNGTVVLDRHLRVDEVAHPQQVDHRRCVFVGNLGFVDDESTMQAAVAEAEGQKRKVKKGPPGDAEEGLWREFGKAGKVESVRVVRDAKTRVGKGFAYVQFEDENAVEAALLFNDKKFPPLLPRKLRVVRAKKPSIARKTSNYYQEQEQSGRKKKSTEERNRERSGGKIRPTKAQSEQASRQGRAQKLLGRAGAATARDTKPSAAMPAGIRKPESFVFEGHRASSTQGNRHLKLGGSGKKKGGKSRNRSTKRSAAWKTRGAK